MKKLAAAIVAMSVSALLCATTEAPKTTEKPAETTTEKACSSASCSKQATPVAQTAPAQLLAQVSPAPVVSSSPVAATSTMTADQQAFCNKLNAKCQQTFKSMDNDARQACMEAAKSKEPNQACEDAVKIVAKK